MSSSTRDEREWLADRLVLLLTHQPRTSIVHLARLTSFTYGQVTYQLQRLVEEGRLVRVPVSPPGGCGGYRVAPQEPEQWEIVPQQPVQDRYFPEPTTTTPEPYGAEQLAIPEPATTTCPECSQPEPYWLLSTASGVQRVQYRLEDESGHILTVTRRSDMPHVMQFASHQEVGIGPSFVMNLSTGEARRLALALVVEPEGLVYDPCDGNA